MPRHILSPSVMRATNARTPWVVLSTTSCAKTTATFDTPPRGVAGGIDFAAASDGVCRSKDLPSGDSVAVVSMLRASRPWPTSVSMNSPHSSKLSSCLSRD